MTWSSSDLNMATVENGVVTAVGAGTATITVTTENGGYAATCEVTVTHTHSEEIIPGKAATCTETGMTEGKKCTRCGEILEEPTEIPAPAEAPPAPEAEVMPAIPAPVAPIPVPTGEMPFDAWTEVLDHLRSSCPPIFGILDGTTALLKDGGLVICVDNPLLAQLLKEGGNKQQLQNAIQHVTGRTYQMALRRKQQIKKAEADPLSQLLTAGRDAGINVNENE